MKINPFRFFNAKPPADPIPPYQPPANAPVVDQGVRPMEEKPFSQVTKAETEAAHRALVMLMHPRPPEVPKAAPVAPPKPAPKWTDQFPWFRPEVNFYPTRAFLDEICRRTSTLVFTSEEKSKLKNLSDEKARIYSELETVNFDAARLALDKIHISNEAAILAGEMPEPVPDLDALRTEYNVKRAHLRAQLRSGQSATKPIVQGICNRLAEASKQLAETLQTQEQSEAAKWGQPYQPSAALCAIVWLADVGFKHQATVTTGPDNLLFGIFGHADYGN